MATNFTPIASGSGVTITQEIINTPLQSLDDAIVNLQTGGGNGITQTKLKAPTTLTIASDTVTRTQEWHRVDTEAAGAFDDLKTISGGVDGYLIIIQIVSNGRVVTVKHNTGNIYLQDGVDRVLNDTNQNLRLMYSNLLTKWIEIGSVGYLTVRETLTNAPAPVAQLQLPDRVLIGSTARQRRAAVMPSLEVSNWWYVRAAAAVLQPVGIAALTNAATTALSLSNQTDSTYVNVASGGASGNCGGFGSTTFDLVRRQYNPVFEWIMMTGAAADIGNVRFWQGLFQQAPTNVATLAAGTAAFAFRFDSALDTNWMGVTDDGTNQSPTPANTGVAVAANTRYKFRIRVDSANGIAYFSVNDSVEVSLNVNLPATTQNLGFNFYNFTTAALAKNWLFSRALCQFS
jgi:hypothetical protein